MTTSKALNEGERQLIVTKNELPNAKHTPISISVSLKLAEHILAIASADRLSRRQWNISRLYVPEGHRSIGVGSLLLERLKQEVCHTAQFKILTVSPGGYNTHPKLLEQFYTRNGFTREDDGQYVWRKRKPDDIPPGNKTGTFTRT